MMTLAKAKVAAVAGAVTVLLLVMCGLAQVQTADMPTATALPATQAAAPTANAMPMRGNVMGTLVKVDGKNLVINAQRGAITVPTDETTVIRVNFDPGKLEDLKAEMRITVITRPRTRNAPAGLLVMAESPTLDGTVIRVEGRNLVIRQAGIESAESGERIVSTDENTKYIVPGIGRTAGRIGSLEEVKPGMFVKVIPQTGAAEKILIGPVGRGPGSRASTDEQSARNPADGAGRAAEEQTQGGLRRLPGPYQTVLKVEEGSITVKLVPTDTEGGKEVTVAISQERTRVRIGEVTEEKKNEDGTVMRHVVFKDGKLGDVKVGQKLNVIADDEGAREIQIRPELPKREGGKLVPATRPAQAVAAQTRPTGRPWLGMVLITVEENRELARDLGYTGDTGLVVNHVYPGSPADGILRLGDIVTKVDGEKLEGIGVLQDHVDVAGVGGKLTLTVFRDREVKSVNVTVEAAPPSVTLSHPPGK